MNMPLRLLAVVTVLSASMIGAGCGSNATSGSGAESGSATSASATGSTVDAAGTQKLTASEKAVKFAACMRENGVGDFPDPTDKNADNYGVSVSKAVFVGAADACKALKPPGALSSKYTPRQLSAAVRFAQCMREKGGVKDFPDPVNGKPLIDTTKIPSSNKPGGMTILNAGAATCGALLRSAMGGQ